MVALAWFQCRASSFFSLGLRREHPNRTKALAAVDSRYSAASSRARTSGGLAASIKAGLVLAELGSRTGGARPLILGHLFLEPAAHVSFPGEVTHMRATIQARGPEETAETFLDADERERTLRALDALLEGDEAEQQETFAFLKESLDQDPPSSRKLFSF